MTHEKKVETLLKKDAVFKDPAAAAKKWLEEWKKARETHRAGTDSVPDEKIEDA